MIPGYFRALREMTRDAREITGCRKVPAHLRVAVQSHALRLARVRLALR